jgi:hypothetical protein
VQKLVQVRAIWLAEGWPLCAALCTNLVTLRASMLYYLETTQHNTEADNTKADKKKVPCLFRQITTALSTQPCDGSKQACTNSNDMRNKLSETYGIQKQLNKATRACKLMYFFPAANHCTCLS